MIHTGLWSGEQWQNHMKAHFICEPECADRRLSFERRFLSKETYNSMGYFCKWLAQIKICELAHSQKNIHKTPTSGKSHLRRWYITGILALHILLVPEWNCEKTHVLCSYWPPIAPVYCPQTRCPSLVMSLKHWVICWLSKRNSSIQLEIASFQNTFLFAQKMKISNLPLNSMRYSAYLDLSLRKIR